jgi:hypothetical protein
VAAGPQGTSLSLSILSPVRRRKRARLDRTPLNGMAPKPAVAPVIKCDELNRSADRAAKDFVQRLHYGDSIGVEHVPRKKRRCLFAAIIVLMVNCAVATRRFAGAKVVAARTASAWALKVCPVAARVSPALRPGGSPSPTAF